MGPGLRGDDAGEGVWAESWYLVKIVEARNINLHWLITGHGPMRVGEIKNRCFVRAVLCH